MAQDIAFIALTDKVSINKAQLLGGGSTGNVYAGFYRSSIQDKPLEAAIKVIHLQTINTEVMGYLLQCQIQAMKLLSKTKNPFIVMLYDVIFLENNVYIVMERLFGGTLRDYMNKYCGALENRMALQIFAKIIQGYSSLSANKIIHRDLKPENIIFRDRNYMEPCIIDFGYCVSPQVKKIPKMGYNVGSPKYMSPQAYQLSIYSEKSDIWALGVVLYQMFVGKAFDDGIQISQSLQILARRGVPYPINFDPHLANFLNHLLIYSLQKRVNFQQVRASVKNNFDFTNQSQKMSRLKTQNPQQMDLQLPFENLRKNSQCNQSISLSERSLRRISSDLDIKRYKTFVFGGHNQAFQKHNNIKMMVQQPTIRKQQPHFLQSIPSPLSKNYVQQRSGIAHVNITPPNQLHKKYSHQPPPTFFKSVHYQNQIHKVEKNQIKILKQSQFINSQILRYHHKIKQNFASMQIEQHNIKIAPKCQKILLNSPRLVNQNSKKRETTEPANYNKFVMSKNSFPHKKYVQIRKIVKIN